MGFVEKKIGKHQMRIDAKMRGIHSTLRKWKSGDMNAKREPELLHVIEKEIKPGMIVVDLGANIGYLSLIMADLMKGKGFLHCIEPDPRNIKLLTYNIKVNKYNFMQMYPLAISNKKGKSNFCLGSSSNLSSMTKTKNTKGKIEVKVNTLTNFFKHKDFPNFIKTDIEGAEVEMMDGAYEMFKENNFPCKIIMEIHPKFYSKTHSLAVQMNKYFGIGFKTKYVISAAVPIPDLFKKMGYDKPLKVFKSSGYNRGLYDNFTDKDMIKVACHAHKQYVKPRKKWSNKIVRYVMIERT